MKLFLVSSLLGLVSTGAFVPSVLRSGRHVYSRLQAVANDDVTDSDSRRAFLWTGASAAAAFAWSPLSAYAASSIDYKAVASDISEAVRANPDWGPTLVRLAWHSSGTYDKMSNSGGSGGGTIRFKEELEHGANAGLGVTAVKWMEPIYAKYKDAGLSYADLYTLAGGESCKSVV